MTGRIDELPDPFANPLDSLPDPFAADYKKPGVVLPAVKRLGGRLVQSTGQALEDLGVESAAGLTQRGRNIQDRNPAYVQSLAELVDRPAQFVGETLADGGAQVGTSALGAKVGGIAGGLIGGRLGGAPGAKAGAKIGATFGGSAPLALQPYGGMRDSQAEQGVDDPGRAVAASAASAAVERLGLEKLAGKLVGGEVAKLARDDSRYKEIGKSALRGGLVEPPTEGIQTGIERLGGYRPLWDEEALDEYGVAMLGGLVSGAGIGGGLGALTPREQAAPGSEFSQGSQAGGPPGTTPQQSGPAGALPPPTYTGSPGDPAAEYEAQRVAMENRERAEGLYSERAAEEARRQAAIDALAPQPGPQPPLALPAPELADNGVMAVGPDGVARPQYQGEAEQAAATRQQRSIDMGLTPDVVAAQQRRQSQAQDLATLAQQPNAGPLTKAVGNNIDGTSLGQQAPRLTGPGALEGELLAPEKREAPKTVAPRDQDLIDPENYQKAMGLPMRPDVAQRVAEGLAAKGVESEVLPHPNKPGMLMVVPKNARTPAKPERDITPETRRVEVDPSQETQASDGGRGNQALGGARDLQTDEGRAAGRGGDDARGLAPGLRAPVAVGDAEPQPKPSLSDYDRVMRRAKETPVSLTNQDQQVNPADAIQPEQAANAAERPAVPEEVAAASPTGQASTTPAADAAPASAGEPIVEHVTKKGKTLRGVVRRGITLNEAKAIDPYAFKKDGGIFIREDRIAVANVAAPEADAQPATEQAPASPVKSSPGYLEDGPSVPDAKFKPGETVTARPGRTIDEAKVVRVFDREVAGMKTRVAVIERPDGKRLQVNEGELSAGRFGSPAAGETSGKQAQPAGARRPQPGESGYTLVDAMNDLMELRAQAESQGRVADSRLMSSIRQQEKLVRDMEAGTSDGALSDDELSTLFDEAAAELREQNQEQPDVPPPGERVVGDKPPPGGWTEADKVPKAPPKTASKPDPKVDQTAAKLVAEAARQGVKGIDEALTGLTKLFGGNNTLRSFPGGIDPDTYAQAKPHFEAALKAFIDAGKTIKDLFKFLIQNFGEGVKPYAIQFAREKGLGANLADSPKQAENQAAGQPRSEDSDEQFADGGADQGRAETLRDGGSAAQPGDSPADSGGLGTGSAGDGAAAPQDVDPGRPGVREPRADVAPDAGAEGERAAADGRARAGGTRDPAAGNGDAQRADDGAGSRGGVDPTLTSPAAAAAQAQDFILDNPLEILGGTPVQRFNRNREALELLQDLKADGRQATPDEQRTLAGYIGWGSFGQELFQGSFERPAGRDEGIWKERGQWLRDTLGKEAWESAQRSITNAHFTDPPTVMAMWQMAERLGFDGGKVLEPSMGTGNFFSMMPRALRDRSKLSGIELDETTGAIAQQLFPQSNIQIKGFQDSKTPDGFYDLAIGNWPFENTPVADRRYNKFNPYLHDYFFLKTIDQVRPGGLIIGITSAGTMDKVNPMIRREMAKKAELVTSIRLPSGAFAEYAGTKVVTDIVILRKRAERIEMLPESESWLGVKEVPTPAGVPVRINTYYAENPDKIIGTLNYGRGTTTFNAGMIVERPADMADRLKAAVTLVPENVMTPRNQTSHIAFYANKTGERNGALSLVDGKLMVARGDVIAAAEDYVSYKVKGAKETEAREEGLKSIVDLRKKYVALIDAERAAEDAGPARKALKKAFDSFRKDHGDSGRLRGSFALKYLERLQDPFYASLAALEHDDGAPATILSRTTTRGKATLEKPGVRDAFVLARNESPTPSLERIAELAKKSPAEVKAELINSGAVFEAPSGDIIPSDMYLSGNVRQKLREAEAALAEGNAAMDRNIAELKKVVPRDVPYFNIETKLGATWVSNDIYKDYIRRMLSLPANSDGITVDFRSGRWKVRLEGWMNRLPEAATNFGSPHVPFSRLVQAAISNQVLRLESKDDDGNKVYDPKMTEEANASIAKIREDFAQWAWADPERRFKLEREYNEARNAWATPKYDGSFLKFEGMALELGNRDFNLRQHQANAIWRAIVNRRSINAHEVGTGKTFTMGGIAIESRRYGIAKKPLILAHNANSATVAKEIEMMYPNARVLYVDNLDAKNKAIRLRQIANDDWDAVVMPHSLLDRLALREETLMAMAKEDILALEQEIREAAEEDGVNMSKVDIDSDDDIKKIRSQTAKELAKQRKRIIESIKKQAQASSKEDAVAFEDLGVDMVLVDEVHEFKKPPIVTRMKMKGLNTQTSNRSIALQFMTRYVRQMNNGGNVHTFTGTPITNTITEIYHQMRYVMDAEMSETNVADWDGWFGSFATELQDVELSAAGEYEMVTRLAGFVNVPELRKMVGQYMDTVFADDMPEMKPRRTKSGKIITDELTEQERAELMNGRTEGAMDRPYKKVVNAAADMTGAQTEWFERLQQFAREWRSASGKEKRQIMNSGDPRSPIVTEGIANKASFDVRMLDPELAGMEGKTDDDPNSKISRAVANVLEIFNSDPMANQVVFTDMGFSKSVTRERKGEDGTKTRTTVKVFSPIHDLVERLVQGGIPRAQVVIVDGKVNKERRREIAEAMNSGKIRVVIGSTDTLGVGVNMQRNLRAMHHLDAPYMPGELEQRNGRGLRQGNQWNTVLEYRYMTDRLDGRRWQILAVKQRFITSFMKANDSVRTIEGEAAADEQSDILESFSEAAGDPRVLIREKLRKKLENLKRKERLHAQGIADMRGAIRAQKARGAEEQARLDRWEEAGAIEGVLALVAGQKASFVATINGETFSERKKAFEPLQAWVNDNLRVGSLSQKIGTYGEARHEMLISWPQLSDVPVVTINAFGEAFEGKGLIGAETMLRNFPDRVAKVQSRAAEAEKTVATLAEAVRQPFGRAEELAKVGKQFVDLERDLEINPVPPPSWLRQGAPVDSEVFFDRKPYVVTGHRYGGDGWFVLAEDDKGATIIPYLKATDAAGLQVYEEREFVPPKVNTKDDRKDGTDDEAPDLRADDGRPVVVGFTAKQAREIIRRRFGKGAENLERAGILKMISSPADYPPQYAAFLRKMEGAASIKGFYDPDEGAAYVIPGNIKSEDDLVKTVLHEIGEHYGLKTMMGDDAYARLLKQLSAMKAANPRVRDAFEKVGRLYKHLEPGSERFLREVLASASEDPSILTQPWYKQLIQAIRRFLFKTGIVPIRFSDAELAGMVAASLRQSMRLPPGGPRGSRREPTMERRGDDGIDFRLDDPAGTISRISAAAQKLPSASDFNADKRSTWLKALTRQQIVDVGKEQFNTASGNLAQQFERIARQIEADSNNELNKPIGKGRRTFGEIAEAWAKMASPNPLGGNRAGAAQLARLMHDATLAGLDPDLKMPEGADPAEYARLRKAFTALPADVQTLYRDVRDAYAKRREDFEQALTQRIEESKASGSQKRAMLNSLRQQFEAGRVKGPYFPLARFGDYYVVAEKDGQREFVMAESQAEQRRESERLRAEGFTVRAGKSIKGLASEMGKGNSTFIADMVDMIDQEVPGPEADALKDGLWQMYLQSLPELSVRKKFIHRKGTPGFSQDALRAFASQIGHGSKQIARLRHAHKLSDALRAMKEHAPDAPDPNKAADILKALDSSYQWMMNPNNASWANNLTNLGFAWYLGVTPAAAAVNLTQLPIVTLPVLAAKNGWAAASSALGAALKDYTGSRFNKAARAKLEGERGGDLGRMLKELEDSGAISRTMSMSLMGLSDANSAAAIGSQRVMKLIGGLFHGAEVMNREVTAIAAYRLARNAGKSHEDATQSAYDAIFESHFDYSSENRAEFMRGNVARVILLFKQYSQNMSYFLARNFHQTFKGASKEERREAATKLFGVVGMTGAFAGTMGLPLVGMTMTLAGLLEGLLGDDDEPWDVEAAYRMWLDEQFGAAGDVLAKGVGNLTGADIASRTSLGELWFRRPSRDLEGQAMAQHYIGEILGPVVGIGVDMTVATQLMAEGKLFRGFEKAMPKFARDFMKTYRFADEGATSLRGDPVVEQFSAGELAMQASGLAPAVLNEQYDRTGAMKRIEQRIMKRRQSLMTLYVEAANAGDEETMRETIAKIARYNKAQPSWPITSDSLRQSIRSRANYSERMIGGVGINPKLRDQVVQQVWQ